VQLSHTVTHQKENLSHSGQLGEPLFHSYTHVSLPKANGTYRETFHSIPGAANFLPDMKKCTVLKCSTGCHSHPSPLAQLSTTLKTKGEPRERQLTKLTKMLTFSQQFCLPKAFSFYYPT